MFTNLTIEEVTRVPVGYSVHLAIEKYCYDADKCVGADLDHTLDAGRIFYELAKCHGFKSALQLNDVPQFCADDVATKANLEKHICAAKKLVADGDYFIVTFAGYGLEPSILDKSSTVRGWYLDDCALTFTDLFALVGALGAGVRVLIVSNSCYSGSLIVLLLMNCARAIVRLVRAVSDVFHVARPFGVRLKPSVYDVLDGPVIVHLAGCKGNSTLPDTTEFADSVDAVVRSGQMTFSVFFDTLKKHNGIPKEPTLQPDADKIPDSGFTKAGPFRIL